MGPIRCVLYGGYGYGNVGDELTLAVALKDMQKQYGNSVAILSPHPGYTKALFPRSNVVAYEPVQNTIKPQHLVTRIIKAIHRRCGGTPSRSASYDPNDQFDSRGKSGWANVIRGCEIFHLVGGGYLTDLLDFERGILAVEVARLHGADISTSPLGIGPIVDPWNAEKLSEAFQGTQILVRDEDSQSICQHYGILAKIQPDDGFRVQEVVDFDNSIKKTNRPIGINFYLQHGASNADATAMWWIEVLKRLKSKNLPLEGFCFHNTLQSDYALTVKLFSETGLPVSSVCLPNFDFRDACKGLSNYSAIITSRFHAAVVAGAIGVPTIAVADGKYYQSKMAAACHGFSTSHVVDPTKTDPDKVLKLLRQKALPN